MFFLYAYNSSLSKIVLPVPAIDPSSQGRRPSFKEQSCKSTPLEDDIFMSLAILYVLFGEVSV